MEFFNNTKAVKLRSHLDKYLVADDDQETTRQSRNGGSRKSRWLVEVVDRGTSATLRLKSCHGKYLTASNEPFLLGMTGRKIFQTVPENMNDTRTEWEPIRDGFQVKLRACGGTYLRANGGTPPWRNSITHDKPRTGILWEVEAIDIPENESLNDYFSFVSSFSSVSGELSGLELGSPMSIPSSFNSPMVSTTPRKVCFQVSTIIITFLSLRIFRKFRPKRYIIMLRWKHIILFC